MLVLNLSLGSELVPNHPAKIPFAHVILEFWKTDKVFTFAADYMLGVYAYVYAHIKTKTLAQTLCLMSTDTKSAGLRFIGQASSS